MRCVWPLPPDVGVNRIDARFLDPNYPTWRKQAGLTPDEHPGIDINLSGTSGNADEGYPVVAILPGKVVHAKQHRVWGNIVLIEHPPVVATYYGLTHLYSQYAHLKYMAVNEGDYLLPGEPVGSIGKGDPTRPFMAHVHFELRTKSLPADYWPRTKANITSAYIDPEAFLLKHANKARRYYFAMGRIFPGRQDKLWVVNMDDPNMVQVGTP